MQRVVLTKRRLVVAARITERHYVDAVVQREGHRRMLVVWRQMVDELGVQVCHVLFAIALLVLDDGLEQLQILLVERTDQRLNLLVALAEPLVVPAVDKVQHRASSVHFFSQVGKNGLGGCESLLLVFLTLKYRKRGHILVDLVQVAWIFVIFEHESHIQTEKLFDLSLDVLSAFLLLSWPTLRLHASMSSIIVVLFFPIEGEWASRWISWLQSSVGIGGMTARGGYDFVAEAKAFVGWPSPLMTFRTASQKRRLIHRIRGNLLFSLTLEGQVGVVPNLIRMQIVVGLQVPDLLRLAHAPMPLLYHLPQTLFKIIREILELLELHQICLVSLVVHERHHLFENVGGLGLELVVSFCIRGLVSEARTNKIVALVH